MWITQNSYTVFNDKMCIKKTLTKDKTSENLLTLASQQYFFGSEGHV